MYRGTRLILDILESFLADNPYVSIRSLYEKTGVSQWEIKYVLSVLEKRGYVVKHDNSSHYMLTEKMVVLTESGEQFEMCQGQVKI